MGKGIRGYNIRISSPIGVKYGAVDAVHGPQREGITVQQLDFQ